MVDKSLRILIADSLPAPVLRVERMLNRLGYYRIATASSLNEARSLGQWPSYPFDVIVASARLLSSDMQDSNTLLGVCRNALVYQSQHLRCAVLSPPAEGTVTRLPGVLDASSLARFMALIDTREDSCPATTTDCSHSKRRLRVSCSSVR